MVILFISRVTIWSVFQHPVTIIICKYYVSIISIVLCVYHNGPRLIVIIFIVVKTSKLEDAPLLT